MKTSICLMVLLLTQTTSVYANVYARTLGDTTQIWDTGVEWSCSGRFFPVTRISGDTLYVIERDTAQSATCLCFFDVCTKVAGLQPGTYTAAVTRRHEVRFSDSVHVFEEFAGSVTFTIANPSSLVPGVALYQSSCRNTPESVRRESSVPGDFLLLTTYPNPFNPSAVVRYGIPKTGRVLLNVYNMAGQQIATLVSGMIQAGIYEVVFDSTNLPSGVYVCHLICDGLAVSSKMVLAR